MNRPLIVHSIIVGVLALGVTQALANPQGGQVASGAASINSAPNTVTINQTSDKAIINWQSFSIGNGETTKFIQPSSTSATLNRVLGGETSIINGNLTANGQIYLINGNGIVVGPGGAINANSFTASTRDINDDDFLSGNLHFSGNNSSGVQNFGTINAIGGDVYLIGKTVDNQGSINATNGTVGLASGDDVLLNLAGQEHVFINPTSSASPASTQTAVHNSGNITAAQAELKAANGNLFALAINNEGAIRATAVQHRGGRIFLTTDAGSIQNKGTITAKNGQDGGKVNIAGGSVWNINSIDVSGVNGGSVTVNSQNFDNDGLISARGTAGKGGSVAATFSGNALAATSGLIDASGWSQGGSIQLEGTGAASEAYLSLAFDVSSIAGAGGEVQLNTFSLYLAGASVNANGATQGGKVFLGKDDPSATSPSTATAQSVYVTNGTSITANATDKGNGGQITTYSTGSTQFLGSAEAKGGSNGGNGGLIEVSGEAATYFGGQANASAPGGGTAGTFLLDPKYITVAAPDTGIFQFVDPDPGANNQFGSEFLNLTGNTAMITSPGDSFGGTGAGAVYLFNSTTGALISSLRGSHANDSVGSDIVQLFSGTNVLVVTPTWNSSTGAVTYFNGTTGVNGAVSASNSLVGSVAGDSVGSGGITQLYESGNYNYLVSSPKFNGNAGAVTWVNGTSGLNAVVSASNSLVGASANDNIGSGGIIELYENGNYNYLVVSPLFDGGAGAVTWGSGMTGAKNVVSASNSLVGASPGDSIGTGPFGTDIVQLGESGNTTNYLVLSPSFNNSAGAVTWGSGTAGVTGVVSASTNSLVGASAGDGIGNEVDEVFNNTTSGFDYLVVSPNFNHDAGAVTYGSGIAKLNEVVGAADSLVGASANDSIGSGGIITSTFNNNNTDFLPNGSYLIVSPSFAGGAGAVTFGSVTSVPTGQVSASNSLVGSAASDNVGSGGVYVLSSGNYVVDSPNFASNTGAVTWGSGSSGVHGTIDQTNSLIGANQGDSIGSDGIIVLTNGNYVVVSTNYQGVSGTASFTGAVTWGDGFNGTTGIVGPSNSLVGSVAGDDVGGGSNLGVGVVELSTGNYAVISPNWNGQLGAVTLVEGDNGVPFGESSPGAAVSATNSVVGATTGDQIGLNGVTDLENGFYAIVSPQWNGNMGAVTWVSGSSGVIQDGGSSVGGAVSSSTSLVGSAVGDKLGDNGIWNIGEGSLLLLASPDWSGGKGAITFISLDQFNGNLYFTYSGGSELPPVGVLSSSNSLVGTATNDKVGNGTFSINGSGSFSAFASVGVGNQILETLNNNLIIGTPGWSGGKGAFTYINLGTGENETGIVGPTNSLVGTSDATFSSVDQLVNLNNGNYAITSPEWNGGVGAVTWYDGVNGTTIGTVGLVDSLTGSVAGDNVGLNGITVLSNGNYLVDSPNWNSNRGAVTLVEGDNGVPYGDSTAQVVLNTGDSLTGATAGDQIGSGGIQLLSNGNYLVFSPSFQGDAGTLSNAGAVTWGDGSATSPNNHIVSSANSLVGANDDDSIGSNGIAEMANGNYFVLSPDFNNDAGAVTWGDGSVGISGVVSVLNSLVGSNNGDEVGSNVTGIFSSSNLLVVTPNWNNNTGAVTFMDGSGAGPVGVVSSANSLVGAAPNDFVGSGGISQVLGSSGFNYVVMSPNWNGSRGAATWGSGTTGISGVVSTSNSITGGSTNADMLTFTTYTGNNAFFVVQFLTDTAHGGDGSVYAESVDGPNSVAPINPNTLTYSNNPGSSVTIDAASITAILDNGTDVTMQANSDITVNQDLITEASGSGGSLTLDAGRSILINANITTDNGNLTLLANDPNAIAIDRDPGLGNIVQSAGTIDVGTGTLMATIGGSANAGSITLDAIDAGTVQISALNSTSNITLGGSIQATNTTLDAGNAFINNAGANAITGQWNIYSSSPFNDSFGGLASNNLATWGATPTTSVGSGNNYLFAYSPTLSVVANNRIKPLGATIDYTTPQVGIDYDVNGFVSAASFGNVFTQDTVANTLTGAPILTSQGAPASASTGSYPITLSPNNVALSRSGFTLTFPGLVNGAVPAITVGSFFDDDSGNPISEEVATFCVTGLNNRADGKFYYIYDPEIETFVPVMVGTVSGGAINQGNGRNIAMGSSTSDAPGTERLVVPGNGIWNIFGGLVHSAEPPPLVMQQFQLNLNPTVYTNMHPFVFGH